MKTKLLYLLAVLCIMAGCSGSKDDPEPEKTYLLQRKISDISFPKGGGGTIKWNYTYNNKNELIQIDSRSEMQGEIKEGSTWLQYNEQGQLKHISNGLGWVWELFYNDNKQLVKIVRVFKELAPTTYLYKYNHLGKLEELKQFSGEETEPRNGLSTIILYNNASQITIKRISASGEEYDEAVILTDNKKRPLPALPNMITMSFHTSDFMAEGIITNHNLLHSKVRQIKPTTTVDGSFTNTFTYNEAGYPLSCIKTFDAGSVEKITYTYSEK